MVRSRVFSQDFKTKPKYSIKSRQSYNREREAKTTCIYCVRKCKKYMK